MKKRRISTSRQGVKDFFDNFVVYTFLFILMAISLTVMISPIAVGIALAIVFSPWYLFLMAAVVITVPLGLLLMMPFVSDDPSDF